MGSPNSVIIRIGRRQFRALVDTGAEVSVMNTRVYRALHPKPQLKNRDIILQTANGSPLKIDGQTRLDVKIGNQCISHKFIVVNNLNRNIILGRDWLTQNGVRLYFDLGALRINSEFIALEDDIHISSLVRLKNKITLKPQHIHTCTGKTRLRDRAGETLEVEQLESGHLSNLCGISVASSVVKLGKARRLPLVIVNNTNQTVTLKRGCPVARLITPGEVNEISPSNRNTYKVTNEELEKVEVPSQFRSGVQEMLRKNRDVFASDDRHLGRTDTVKMKIDTEGHPPIKKQPYRTPLNQRKVVDAAIEEMMQAGVVERSRSPWGFPIVLVKKKDGSTRFCVDFRALNKISRNNAHPLPVIDDILASLGSAKYVSKLDLKSGYWQVQMHEADKEKTAFTCHRGLFHFNVMPFGVAGGPGVFQELMSIVLQGQEDFALAYLDDILVYSDTAERHMEHIQKVLCSLRKHHLKLKPDKCEFFKTETQYLGFRISDKGIQPDHDKVKAIQAVSTPTTVRQVRGFIGMCSYYRRFIPGFSGLAEPLIRLTRKYARFQWDEACQVAFDRLKKMLHDMVILAYPDPNKNYKLYTDASDFCIGACLTQQFFDETKKREVEKPIYFLSHKLSDTQTRWSTIEKEAYAIHYALQKLHHYLHSATFTIYTDHRPLQFLLNSPMQNKKIQLWALSIAGYNCSIEYLQGKNNVCADLLSRSIDAPRVDDSKEVEVDDRTYQVAAINSNEFEPRQFAAYKDDVASTTAYERPTIEGIQLVREQEADRDILELKYRLRNGKATKLEQKKFIIMDEIVYYLSQPDDEPVVRLYVPSQFRPKVIIQYHDDNGHMGTDKTYHAIKQKYFWPCLFREVVDFVNKCVPCQSRNLTKIQPRMQETDMPPFPFAKIALDISGPYPQTLSGNQYIVTFIDMYSGWPEAFAVPNKKAETVAYLLIEEIFPRFGAPLELVTDNGPENINKTMKETLENLNVNHVKTSFYHPQSNGKVERLHRTMHDILAKKIGDNANSWDLHINQMLAAIRFNVSESTKFSPFYLIYNRDVVLPLDTILKPRRVYYGEEHHHIAFQEQHRAFTLVRNNLKKAKNKQIERSNSKTNDVDFKVGDLVYYKNHHRRGKLDKRWKPYYIVIEKTGPVSYKIKDQLTSSVVKVHAEQLRQAKIEQWVIPTANRPLRKATLAAPVDSDDSNKDSDIEVDNFPSKRCERVRTNSENESDIPIMQRGLALQQALTEESDDSADSEGELPYLTEVSNQGLTCTNRESASDSEIDAGHDHMEIGETRKKLYKKRKQVRTVVQRADSSDANTDANSDSIHARKLGKKVKRSYSTGSFDRHEEQRATLNTKVTDQGHKLKYYRDSSPITSGGRSTGGKKDQIKNLVCLLADMF